MAELEKNPEKEVPEKDEQESAKKEEKKRKSLRKELLKKLAYGGIFLTVAFFLFVNRVTISEQADSFIDKIPIIGQLRHLANSSDRELKGEKEGRINILLLGIGGRGHEGGLLTDTIILSSLDPDTKKVSMVSIPRDMSIPIEGDSTWTKINNINAFAEMKEAGSGGMAISQAVADIMEVPIDYYVRVDFQGFKNIIDKIGGIEINVEKTFDDYSYPVSGREDDPDYYSRFEHLHFDKGWQKMDGETALKYARSRHGTNGEASDFARAKRQQLVIQAAKEKLLKANTLLNPVTLTGIITELNEHVSTNLKVWEIIKLWSNFKDVEKENIISKVLDNSAGGLLKSTINEKGSYVLLPTNGDFSEIKYLIQNIFQEPPKEEKAPIVTERTKLKILNGTWINGLANRTSTDLEKYGFDIIAVGNSSRRNFDKSVIYDLAFGEKMKSLSLLKEKTEASVTFELPEWLKEDLAKELEESEDKEKPDFVLVLGQDADKTKSGTENRE
jgi:polyisoprenyl-teichoic acid--peptidoglycan teichoic acid transferase